ncbi:cytochrome c biogenesis protein [Novosphingobium sp. Rr 2-17]|uniref:cytochrome c-type biogenesis protein n=1 Tax=Novosphingobium sp. Rr 2-17 TaxID=555793 RepID=UPI000269925F|nr:cytochrome c-type biogenesis protein [Novosphingobium sp. Rr 2-17]EIZ77553.1 cytochrome c biogenesis protein [Novosphingobium sp. Rr 2-17]
MTRLFGLILAALALAFALPIAAQEEQSTAPYAYRQLDDPAKEARAMDLMQTLRCLQCQGQSIADSDAPIAGSMRSLVRERIAHGEDPEAIRRWLIERYGDYVSYAPQISSLTWPLFAVPVALVLLAAVLLRRRFKRGGAL